MKNLLFIFAFCCHTIVCIQQPWFFSSLFGSRKNDTILFDIAGNCTLDKCAEPNAFCKNDQLCM